MTSTAPFVRDGDEARLQAWARATGCDANQEWPDDPTWVIRYTDYAEVLIKAERIAKACSDPHADPEKIEATHVDLGDGSLGAWEGLTTPTGGWAEQGKLLYEDVLLPVVDDVYGIAKPKLAADDGSWAVLSWWARLHRGVHGIGNTASRELKEVGASGIGELENLERTLRDRIWSRGVDGKTSPQAKAVPWLRRLTTALDEKVAPFRQQLPDFDEGHPYGGLLPEDLERYHDERAGRTKAYRSELIERGFGALGISELGLTELEQQCLPHLQRRLDQGQSLLVTGPTSTGKTDVGFSAACYSIHQKRRAIIMLPTKALVAQAAGQWADHLANFESTRDWRVVEASRDFPYNDERISRGDWDLMVAIPEKVAGYLASGSSLMRQVGVVVIDEVQTIANRDRGPNIEALLTVLRARHPAVPIVALAAHLDDATRAAIAAWIGADEGLSPARWCRSRRLRRSSRQP